MRRSAAALALALGLLAGPVAAARAAPDPVGAWSFDDAAPMAGAAPAAAGRFGRALAFDGAGGVTLGGLHRLETATALTVEAWVRPAALGHRRAAVLVGGLPHGLYARRGLPLNTWSHLALSYDGATLRSYVDGVLAGSEARAGAAAGRGALHVGRGFSGLVDELRVYDRALSAAEVAADRDTPIASVGLLTRPGAAAAKPRSTGRARRTRLLSRAF